MLWLLLIPGIYLVLVLAIAWFSLHPFRTPLFISPGALGLPQEDVTFGSGEGISLRGWWTQIEGSAKVAVLCHGYLMNRCELIPLGVELAKRGWSTLAFDFRAHGKSGGRKCGLGWREREDVKAAVSFVRQRVPHARIVLVGSSMGAAASALALGDEPNLADGLILDSCYASLSSAVLGWWRFLGGPALSILLSPTVLVAAPVAGFNPFTVSVPKALEKVSVPVLIVHGDADNLALPSEALHNERACPNAELVWMPGCGHSEGRWEHPEAYYAAVETFIERAFGCQG